MATFTQQISTAATGFWPLHGTVSIGANPFDQSQKLLDSALERANAVLEKKGLKVVFLKQIPIDPHVQGINPQRDILLGIRGKEGQGPLDIIDLKALDEVSLKPAELLGEEIIAKVEQHFAARKTQGILFTSSGCKLDGRRLSGYEISIDEQSYLRIDGKRIFVPSDEGAVPLKSMKLRSYTILRFALDKEQKLRIFDDHDLVRLNNKGMFVDPTAIINLSIEKIAPVYQPEAESYQGSYFQLERDSLSEEVKSELLKILQEFPPP
ncbi:MAG: hypothetical protein JSS60_04460 [Verrucomicrobia bacterium]|nr:hypothetical protein [Verrucomicrobiota bacterium]